MQGAVRTNIWTHSPKFSTGIMKWFVDAFYAPPQVRGFCFCCCGRRAAAGSV